MVITLLAGCNNIIKSIVQTKPGIPSAETGKPDSAEAYEPKSLGSATFTVDDSKTRSVDYRAEDTDVSMSVTDGNGLTWRLDIPKDALPQSQTIKMTAMSSVSVDTLGVLAGGVVLEPDGLAFLTPAKLTVTGNGVKTNSLLLTGGQDGSNLAFTSCANKEGVVTADIFHFSTAMMSGSDDNAQTDKMSKSADEQMKNALKEANDLLKRPIDDPPIPPDISLKCKKGTHDLDINKYYHEFLKNFKEPEMSVATALLSAEKATLLLGTSNNSGAMNTAVKLLDRLSAKISKIISNYQSQPDKFYATSAAFVEVERMYQLAGVKGDTNWEPLKNWCEIIAQKFLSDLTGKHDYTTIHALVRTSRMLSLMGGDGDAILTKLENALNFDLKIDLKMQTDAEYYFKYEITGKIPIKLTLGLTSLAVGEASGTCNYTLAESPIGEFQSPKSYPCELMITDFDPCLKDVVKLALNTIGAEEETWYYKLSGQTVTDDNTSQWLAGLLFADEKSTDYLFIMSLKNMDVNAVDETLDKKASDEGLQLEGSINVTLTHKPG
jgi:hypothetical protein